MIDMSMFQLILLVAFIITLIGTILVVISENRNPIRTQAWVLLLLVLPVIGLVIYFFFGQDNRRIKHVSQKYYKRVKTMSQERLVPTPGIVKAHKVKGLVDLLQRINAASLFQGSEVEVITYGPRKFDALMADMRQAKHHIHMEYFIFSNDETGTQVREVLMEKAQEGVEVRFLYDHVASWFVPPRFFRKMKKAGVHVAPFIKVFFPAFRSKINYRNHRKVVVIDGHIGYIGGMNIGNEYALKDGWRDTHLRITGPGVHGLQANFLIDWRATGQEMITDPIYFPHMEPTTENLMQVVASGPVYPYQNILKAALYIVMNARQYVYIQTPYFLPTDSMYEALETMALSGVDVRLMVSKKSDSPYVDPAAQSYYEGLLRAGVRIYELVDIFSHAKTMVCDDYISVIGSANMDFRSFETNFEINAYLYDSDLALKNKAIFFEDLKHCEEIDLSVWVKRPRRRKLLESFMRLLSPLM